MKLVRAASIGLLVLLAGPPASSADTPDPVASAANAAPAWKRVLDNDLYEVSLDLRLRVELADLDGADDAQAYTLRTRLGLGSKPFHGLSVFAEVENVVAFDDESYFDAVSTPNGETVIADPEETELNQLWLRYTTPRLGGLTLKAGRQRIVFDDSRFVGNVGWRQNEQTFDAALAETGLGIARLKLRYAWIDEVHRVFGGDGGPAQRDFDSNSHAVNLSYSFAPGLEATVFAYLLHFDNAAGSSADSYGLRLSGRRELGPEWTLGYVGSYAWQQDADDNPVDYEAHYAHAELTVGRAALATLAVGGEVLGSDQGRGRFVTPLATLHKWNGFADVFLDNGGPNGLRDAYLAVAPRLPAGLQGKLVYHHFWADEGGGSLGDELDVVAHKEIGKGVRILAKAAWFKGRTRGRADLWRGWLQLDYAF